MSKNCVYPDINASLGVHHQMAVEGNGALGGLGPERWRDKSCVGIICRPYNSGAVLLSTMLCCAFWSRCHLRGWAVAEPHRGFERPKLMEDRQLGRKMFIMSSRLACFSCSNDVPKHAGNVLWTSPAESGADIEYSSIEVKECRVPILGARNSTFMTADDFYASFSWVISRRVDCREAGTQARINVPSTWQSKVYVHGLYDVYTGLRSKSKDISYHGLTERDMFRGHRLHCRQRKSSYDVLETSVKL